MKLTKINANESELTLKSGTTILFSYSTPVAGWDDKGPSRTSKKGSVTTSRHINKYLGGSDIGRTVSQDWIQGLVDHV